MTQLELHTESHADGRRKSTCLKANNNQVRGSLFSPQGIKKINSAL